jgi:modification methylase
LVLDPFFGTGTTGAVAKALHRRWIGIEREERYVDLARKRIEAVQPDEFEADVFEAPNPRKRKRIPFGLLVEHGLLVPGQALYFGKRGEACARVLADGSLEYNGGRGSIHQVARSIRQAPCNGWDLWYYQDPENGARRPIDHLREVLRERLYEK